MLVTPDFTEVAEEIKPGTYRGMIKTVKEGSWGEGKPYLNWEIETVGEQDPKNNGRRIFHKTATSGKGAFQLQKLYKAATGSSLTGPFNTDQILGKQVVVELVDGVNRTTGQPSGYIEVKNVRPVV